MKKARFLQNIGMTSLELKEKCIADFSRVFSHFTLIVRNQNRKGIEPLRHILGTRY